jgi:hypothetical protein
MAKPNETVDEFYSQLLRDMIFTLQRLPFGYYKRNYPGAAAEPGHLLDTGEYQALLLLLNYLAKPRQRGRHRLTASARLRKWQQDKDEFEQEQKAIERRTGKKRGSRKAAIVALAARWNVTPEAAKKRIAGGRPSRPSRDSK